MMSFRPSHPARSLRCTLCRLTATAYSIFVASPHRRRASPPSEARGRAVLWWHVTYLKSKNAFCAVCFLTKACSRNSKANTLNHKFRINNVKISHPSSQEKHLLCIEKKGCCLEKQLVFVLRTVGENTFCGRNAESSFNVRAQGKYS